MMIRRLIPDVSISDPGQVKFSMTTKRYPQASEETVKGPFVIQPGTEKVDFRARGRQANIKINCSTTGVAWKYGSMRLQIQPDGGR